MSGSKDSFEIPWKSGSELCIFDSSRQYCSRFLIEGKSKGGIVSLARKSSPYCRLSIGQNAKLTFSDTQDKGCLLRIVPVTAVDGEQLYLIRSCQYELYLSFDLTLGELSASLTPFLLLIQLRLTSLVPTSVIDEVSVLATPTTINETNPMSHTDGGLSTAQLQSLYNEGFLHCHHLVPLQRCQAANKALNHFLGIPSSLIPGGIQGQHSGKFAGGITQRPEIQALLSDALERVVINLFGGSMGCIDKASLQAQIAFRFPELVNIVEMDIENDRNVSIYPRDIINNDIKETNVHQHENYVENMKVSNPLAIQLVNKPNLATVPWHTDGLRQGRAHSFSLLVGVCLSDVCEDYAGNLLLWPRTHTLLHQCKINKYGALDLEKLKRLLGCADTASPSSSVGGDTADRGDNGDGVGNLCNPVGIDASVDASVNAGVDASVDLEANANDARLESVTGSYIDKKDSTEAIIHDNEPDGLPCLGQPLSMKMNIGVS